MNTENPAGQANVLVCVTDQPSCRRLILAGDAIAQKYQVPVKVVTVLKPGLVSSKTADVLQTLYNIAGRLGAEMTVYFNDSPALTVAVHAGRPMPCTLSAVRREPTATPLLKPSRGFCPKRR